MKNPNMPSARSRLFRLALVTLLLTALQSSTEGQKKQSQCSCAKSQIVASIPKGVKEGEIVEFSVETPNFRAIRNFVWTVSEGEIISGQGTAAILVRAPKKNPAASPPAAPSASPTIQPVPSPSVESPPMPPGFVRSSLPYGGPIAFAFKHASLTVSLTMTTKSQCLCGAISMTLPILPTIDPVNYFANVTDLKLSADTLTLPCTREPQPKTGVTPSESMVVDVNTTAIDPEDDVLTYDYTVSAGKILGTGKNVKWDLTGVAPGSYTITAGVDDGCGLCGKTRTEQITIAECEPLCGLIVCPSIFIAGPDTLKDVNDFTADVSGGAVMDITYEWNVTNGSILSGQGTPSIKARLDPTSTVTVKIGGLEKGSCLSSASKVFVAGVLKP